MTKIVTYLEMTARDQLRPAAPVSGLALELLDAGDPLVISLQVEIGAPFGWGSATRTPEQWAERRGRNPDRQHWAVTFEGAPAGMVAYQPQPGDEVEIETFGLTPAFTGRRLGGYALTLGLEKAWTLLPVVKRVWLHTSTQDHPNALPNYRARGLTPYRTETSD
ncbi:N-acetyltransferase [Actinoplanes sp. OR16]|uniref:GNAT family N-acetyltransferase n=1 Tax=Actinoplanes sp. OR16 TaxID=946334 RepID=UPI000F6E57F4|nr:GNAT family N-acetyltransferase [Actinoplanes sp. OR16]BBH69260.1 N-acetyltransferase [Actinoplanes sp. OR16]